MPHFFSNLHQRCPARNSGSGSRTLLAGSLAALMIGTLLFSTPVVAQQEPSALEVQERTARTSYFSGRPGVRYVPGYIDPADGTDDYESPNEDIVYRLEFGVENDGTLSQIPETSRFKLTGSAADATPWFLPLVRNIRGGVLREPFDEVIAVRILDGDPANDELQLCTDTASGGDNDSGEACVDVNNINKNSYFHAYSADHRDPTVVGDPIIANNSGTTEEQECYDAYVEFFGQAAADADPAPTCPVVRYQSERATCIKCITNQYALNRGSDNIFSKAASSRTRNNIGRLDLIIRDPIVYTQAQIDEFNTATGDNLLENVGFLIVERDGNDPIDVAAITAIENIDDVAAGTVDLSAYSNSNPTLTDDLPKMANLIRTYDNPSLELQVVGGEIVGEITPGRSATSIVTEHGLLLEAPIGTWGNVDDIQGTGAVTVSTPTTVFMSSNPAEGEAGHFGENRPDQDLGGQTPHVKFISLADLGIGADQEFFGVSLFASDVGPDDDLITLTDIPRQTSGASGAGGLDLMGGGGFFFREDIPQDPVELTLDECWRTLSSPIQGQTYAEFFASFNTDTNGDGTFVNNGGLWTQGSGITGARAPFGDPNVFTLNSDGTDWDPINPLSGTDGEIPAGTGILISVFENDVFDDPTTGGFPKRASLAAGIEHSAPVTVTFGDAAFPGTTTTPGSNDPTQGFSLLGNPYKDGIDFDALDRTDVQGKVWVYDRNGGGTTGTSQGTWVTWDGEVGDIDQGIIAPGQGFVVQNVDATVNSSPAPVVVFPEISKVAGREFYGKSYGTPDHVRLEVSGEGLYNSAWVKFKDNGSLNVHSDDVIQFMPFESEFAVLSTMKEGQLFDISTVPHVNEEVEIPITVTTTTSDPLTIRLTDMQYRQSDTLYLYDTVTGSSMELRKGMEYEFTPSGTPAKSLYSCYSTPQKAKTTGDVRFLITSSVPQNEPDLPVEFSLAQNYPNPFNPTTQITYQLPQQSDVRLQVFDMAGRQVATLVNQIMSAGTHTVNFDASDLSSGIYMYRLQAGSTVLTRKLTLIK